MSQGKKYKFMLLPLLLGILLLWGCSINQSVSNSDADIPTNIPMDLDQVTDTVQTEINTVAEIPTNTPLELDQVADTVQADVVSVKATGEANTYQFSVGISSPDTGCEQYADWWEVLTEDGELLYRRILGHSHVAEQPFVRSGGPVEIEVDTVVIIRAHMNTGGYAGKAMQGTLQSGFNEVELLPDFAANVENEPPLPTDCAF
ncbi:MAG: hypothetical protein JEZ00_16415 [Anaerolineaceae bacterium]|nr:hypothetical protein [Anaerolineaceae bacterium]